jgi:hypothetical protein
MLYYDVLDEVADIKIPEGKHPLLHVNSREVWVQIMTELLEYKVIDSKYENLLIYAESWEELLYKRFSAVN